MSGSIRFIRSTTTFASNSTTNCWIPSFKASFNPSLNAQNSAVMLVGVRQNYRPRMILASGQNWPTSQKPNSVSKFYNGWAILISVFFFFFAENTLIFRYTLERSLYSTEWCENDNRFSEITMRNNSTRILGKEKERDSWNCVNIMEQKILEARDYYYLCVVFELKSRGSLAYYYYYYYYYYL